MGQDGGVREWAAALVSRAWVLKVRGRSMSTLSGGHSLSTLFGCTHVRGHSMSTLSGAYSLSDKRALHLCPVALLVFL